MGMKTKVATVVTNRFVRFYRPYPHDDLVPYFSFHPKGYRFMPAFRMGHWDGRINLLKRDMVPTGLFYACRREIEEDLNLQFVLENHIEPVEFHVSGITSDRSYQNECVEKMIEASNRRAGGLVLAATGSGKTLTVGLFLSRLKGNACFIVDELTLMKQAQGELSKVLNEEVGEIGDSKFLPKRVTVATSQTLHLHEDDPKFETWVRSLKVNIIDELHQAMNRRNFGIVEAIAPPVVFGLTATLELNKKEVRTKAYALTGPVCYEYPLTQGQEEGHLAKGIVLQVQLSTPDPGGYTSRQFAQQYSDLIVDNPDRNQLVCHLVREAVRRNRYPIVLVERVRHLKLLSKALNDLPHSLVYGAKKVEDRVQAKKDFEAGEVRVLIANTVFQKGIDVKKIDVVIDAGGMKSKNRAVQIFGRGIRLADGKKGLLHFDITDLDNRFERAGKMRRSAFKNKGIPVKKVAAEVEARELFEVGNSFLESFLDDVKEQRYFEFNLR
jgi:DNA repair protein RadD